MQIQDKIKEIIYDNPSKIVIIILFIIAIIISLIISPNTKVSGNEKKLIDSSRINETFNYSDDSVYNTFSFSLKEGNKEALTYFSNDTVFLSADYSKNDDYVYKFEINKLKDDGCFFLVKSEKNLSLDMFKTIVSSRDYKSSGISYVKLNDSLIYYKTVTATKSFFNFIKYFKSSNKEMLLSFNVTISNKYIMCVGNTTVINILTKAIGDISNDNNKTPFLRDKLCFVNLSNYGLNNYKLIESVDKNSISLTNKADTYLLQINTTYDNANVYSIFQDKYSDTVISGYENLFCDEKNQMIVFTDGVNFARICYDNSSKNKCIEFINQNFEKEE